MRKQLIGEITFCLLEWDGTDKHITGETEIGTALKGITVVSDYAHGQATMSPEALAQFMIRQIFYGLSYEMDQILNKNQDIGDLCPGIVAKFAARLQESGNLDLCNVSITRCWAPQKRS